ncbi:MAG: HAD family hydrolase [Clostridia bacterium]|nr:HAD family hydrolase [Clostridia bacterium]
MYKLLTLDIDDTLTHVPTQAPDEIVAAVDRARRAGIRVALATGRGYFASSSIVKQLNICEPVINYGGAIISAPFDGSLVYSTQIPPELVTDILETAKSYGVHAHIYQGDVVIGERYNEYMEAYCARLDLPKAYDPQLRDKLWHNVPKVLMMTTEEHSAQLRPIFQEKYRGILKVSGSSKGFIEFNHPSAHKGSGLAWLADHLGIKQEETVAVGDNSLDIEMIQWAGLGCAVENAKEEIKAAADMVIPSCSECGVAYLIDRLIEGSI